MTARVAASWLVAASVACGGAARVAPRGAAEAALDVAVACGDPQGMVYVSPEPSAPGAAERGHIVRCSRDVVWSPAEVAARAALKGYAGAPLTSGARTFRVAFRTERLAGQPGVSTALVYLPTAPRARPAPAVVVAHGTIGLADGCAPSRQRGAFVDEMAVPLVGMGFAVIAPDYAGLGNGRGATVQGWGIAEDQAHSVLDAARALRGLVGAEALAARVGLVGHSQGGGAVLAAQALARSYGQGVSLGAVVAFAPAWLDARFFGKAITQAATPARGGLEHELRSAFVAMWFYAHWAVYDGMAAAATPFAAAQRERVDAAMRRRCIATLGAALGEGARTFGDLYDPGFVASVAACLDGGGGGAACGEPGRTFLARAAADRPPLDPAGAKVLVVQGLADVIVTPEATACAMQHLVAQRAPARVCTDAGADHLTVPARGAALAAAFLDGAEPACAAALPACR